MKRAGFTNCATSNNQIHIFQAYTIVAKRFMSHLAGFLKPFEILVFCSDTYERVACGNRSMCIRNTEIYKKKEFYDGTNNTNRNNK